METTNVNKKGAGREVGGLEVARIEIGRYVRFYDLSGLEPRLVFELLERPFMEGQPGLAEDHVSAVIDFFELLMGKEAGHGQ